MVDWLRWATWVWRSLQANLLRALSHVPEGTPIVNIDSPVGTDEASALGIRVTTYIGTDNEAAGELAAGAMARLVGRGRRSA